MREDTQPTELRLTLTGVEEPISRGRDFVRDALAAWRPPRITDATMRPAASDTALADVILAVSELLTNALLHGNGPRDLAVLLSDTVLRVEVTDFEPSRPEPRSPNQPGPAGGYGLHIVVKLADRWGADQLPDGKRVWVEFDTARFAAG